MLRLILAAPAAALILAAAPAHAADARLKAAVDNPARAAENRARDAWRHPVQTLAFWGLKPKQTVIEVTPGAGYWTEILSPYASKTGGRYVTAVADLDNPALSAGARKGRADFEARYSDAAKWGPVNYAGFGRQSKPLGAPGSADMVITARNIHNWMWQEGMVDKAMADFYAVLKPGGVLAVEEHRADPRPQVTDARDGYVGTANVIAAAQKAGFRLAAKSELNANRRDTKDHPFGVWTLPPTNRSAPAGQPANPSFDQAKFKAIGESDRMTLRFVKPG